MEFLKKKFKFYNSTISSFSKAPSNSSNSSSELKSFSIKFAKLKGDLQPILGSLGQVSVTKINLSKFLNYKQHLLN